MPCNSDYLNPTHREAQLQRAAKLLKYVYECLGLEVPKHVKETAADIYAKDDRSVMKLCDIIHQMNEAQLNEIVYDGRNKNARDLADWWDEHKAADRRREEEEAHQRQKRYNTWLELKREFGHEE